MTPEQRERAQRLAVALSEKRLVTKWARGPDLDYPVASEEDQVCVDAASLLRELIAQDLKGAMTDIRTAASAIRAQAEEIDRLRAELCEAKNDRAIAWANEDEAKRSLKRKAVRLTDEQIEAIWMHADGLDGHGREAIDFAHTIQSAVLKANGIEP